MSHPLCPLLLLNTPYNARGGGGVRGAPVPICLIISHKEPGPPNFGGSGSWFFFERLRLLISLSGSGSGSCFFSGSGCGSWFFPQPAPAPSSQKDRLRLPSPGITINICTYICLYSIHKFVHAYNLLSYYLYVCTYNNTVQTIIIRKSDF